MSGDYGMFYTESWVQQESFHMSEQLLAECHAKLWHRLFSKAIKIHSSYWLTKMEIEQRDTGQQQGPGSSIHIWTKGKRWSRPYRQNLPLRGAPPLTDYNIIKSGQEHCMHKNAKFRSITYSYGRYSRCYCNLPDTKIALRGKPLVLVTVYPWLLIIKATSVHISTRTMLKKSLM